MVWAACEPSWALLIRGYMLIVSVLGKVKPVTLVCVNSIFCLVKTLISSRILEQLFHWALPLKGSHCTGGVSNVQNRWLEGRGGGRKVGRQCSLREVPWESKRNSCFWGWAAMPDLGFMQVGLAQVKSFSPAFCKSGTEVQLVDGCFRMTYRCVADFCSELPSAPPWQENCCAFILCIRMVSLFIHSRFWTCFAFPSLLRLQFSMFRARISCPLDSSWIQCLFSWLIQKNY